MLIYRLYSKQSFHDLIILDTFHELSEETNLYIHPVEPVLMFFHNLLFV